MLARVWNRTEHALWVIRNYRKFLEKHNFNHPKSNLSRGRHICSAKPANTQKFNDYIDKSHARTRGIRNVFGKKFGNLPAMLSPWLQPDNRADAMSGVLNATRAGGLRTLRIIWPGKAHAGFGKMLLRPRHILEVKFFPSPGKYILWFFLWPGTLSLQERPTADMFFLHLGYALPRSAVSANLVPIPNNPSASYGTWPPLSLYLVFSRHLLFLS